MHIKMDKSAELKNACTFVRVIFQSCIFRRPVADDGVSSYIETASGFHPLKS